MNASFLGWKIPKLPRDMHAWSTDSQGQFPKSPDLYPLVAACSLTFVFIIFRLSSSHSILEILTNMEESQSPSYQLIIIIILLSQLDNWLFFKTSLRLSMCEIQQRVIFRMNKVTPKLWSKWNLLNHKMEWKTLGKLLPFWASAHEGLN